MYLLTASQINRVYGSLRVVKMKLQQFATQARSLHQIGRSLRSDTVTEARVMRPTPVVEARKPARNVEVNPEDSKSKQLADYMAGRLEGTDHGHHIFNKIKNFD